MNPPPAPRMPAAAEYIMTRRIPCAVLAVLMFSTAWWFPALLQGVPLLAWVVAVLAIGIHLLTPGLFALIAMGGGGIFALQVAVLGAVGVGMVAGMHVLPGLAMLLMYGVLPILAAANMQRPGGLARSGQNMAIGLLLAVLVGLLAGANAVHMDMRAYVDHLLAPVFNSATAQLPAKDPQAAAALTEFRRTSVWILPGSLALGLWLVWWGNILLARSLACRYGFFRGDRAPLLGIRFARGIAYAFILAVAVANTTDGDIQYMAVGTAILGSGMLGMQGVAVAHSWLKLRQQPWMIVIMYMMLAMWSVLAIPFVLLGLMDVWFDYRRNMKSAIGG
jgi:Predicted membrane protein (DUF2232)